MSRRRIPSIVLLGAGRFGRRHLETLLQLARAGEVHVAAVVTRTAASAEEIARRYRVPATSELRATLLKGVDGAVIATPPQTHAALAAWCLRRVSVLVEKPVAPSARAVRRLGRQAERAGRVLMAGHIFRFHPAMPAVRRWIERQAGPLRVVRGTFRNPGPPEAGIGAMTTFLHVYDMMDMLIRRTPQMAEALTWHDLRHGAFEDRAAVTVTYPGPLAGWFDVGWGGERKIRTLTLSGAREELRADLASGALERVEADGRIRRSCVEIGEPLAAELRCFIALLRGERRAYPSADVAERVMRVVDAAGRSARTTRAATVASGRTGA